MDLLKVPRFPCQEKLHNKGNLKLAKKGSEGFLVQGFSAGSAQLAAKVLAEEI